jgi:serine/threonine protein kinase
VKIDPAAFPELSKLVDEWLDMPPESRRAWLAALGPEHARLHEILSQLNSPGEGEFLGTLPKLNTQAGPATQLSLMPGELIGPYRLVRELGQGGMSVVWLAERADGSLKREVALKLPFLSQRSGTLAARFVRERNILAALVHPNIARLYDAGVSAQGQPYLALEFVEGEPIVSYCARLGLGIVHRLTLFLEVLRTAQYAHTRLIVHRDLKPSNILVTREGQIRLLDFGIAKLLTEDGSSLTELTRVGSQPLTPGYASPEQIAGELVTTASDVYSLGVLLYELLAEERPYRLKQHTRRELEKAVLEADVRPPSQAAANAKIAATLRGDLDAIVLKSLQRAPPTRYASADAFAQDIERYLRGEAVHAKPQSAWYHLRKFVRRNRIAVASTTAVVTALSVGLGIAEVEKRRAETEAATSKALSDFLQHDLLAQASVREQSTKRPDPDLKVRDALDRAAASVAGRFDSRPLVEASIRETIGNTYRDLGLWAEAVPLFERTVALRKSSLGPNDPETLRALSELGMSYISTAKYAAADRVFTEVYATRIRVFGKNRPETLAAMSDLAILATRQGNYGRAAKVLEETLDVQRHLQGERNTQTLIVMHNLATAYVTLSEFAKAEEVFRKVLDLKRSTLGPEHPSTLAALNGLGSVYRSEGKYDLAAQTLPQALETRRRVLGDRHPDTLDSMSSLALLYVAQADYARAEPLLNQVLDLRRAVLGPEHSTTLVSIYNVAELYRRQGKTAQAESTLTQLAETRRRVLGPNHPATLQTLATLGAIKLAEHRYDDGESLLRAANAGYDKTKSDTWQRYYSQSLLGAVLVAQGHPDPGTPLLHSGYDGLLRREQTIPFDTRAIVAYASACSANTFVGAPAQFTTQCPFFTTTAKSPAPPAYLPPTAR